MRTITTYSALTLAAGAALGLLAVATGPNAAATAEAAAAPQTINMTMAGLAGHACENGTLGTAAGQCNTWNIGRYIKAADWLLLRARAEVENKPPLGSPTGNVAQFYLTDSSLGLGVGSIADVGHPGSKAISGGGPHGSEIIHCILRGDPLIADPKVVLAPSISIRVDDYTLNNSDLSITLHTINGQTHVFPPSVVEPLLTPAGSKIFDLNFASLPGADALPALESFDIRSGWFNTATNKLTGGHFWITRLTLTPVEMSPELEASAGYD